MANQSDEDRQRIWAHGMRHDSRIAPNTLRKPEWRTAVDEVDSRMDAVLVDLRSSLQEPRRTEATARQLAERLLSNLTRRLGDGEWQGPIDALDIQIDTTIATLRATLSEPYRSAASDVELAGLLQFNLMRRLGTLQTKEDRNG